jgi:tRNA A22 N-methylase
MPESELNVSCRFHRISGPARLLDLEDWIEGLLLAGVGGDKIESFLEARLAVDAGLDMFACICPPSSIFAAVTGLLFFLSSFPPSV